MSLPLALLRVLLQPCFGGRFPKSCIACVSHAQSDVTCLIVKAVWGLVSTLSHKHGKLAYKFTLVCGGWCHKHPCYVWSQLPLSLCNN